MLSEQFKIYKEKVKIKPVLFHPSCIKYLMKIIRIAMTYIKNTCNSLL